MEGIPCAHQGEQLEVQGVAPGALVALEGPVITGLLVLDALVEQHDLAAGVVELAVQQPDLGNDFLHLVHCGSQVYVA